MKVSKLTMVTRHVHGPRRLRVLLVILLVLPPTAGCSDTEEILPDFSQCWEFPHPYPRDPSQPNYGMGGILHHVGTVATNGDVEFNFDWVTQRCASHSIRTKLENGGSFKFKCGGAARSVSVYSVEYTSYYFEMEGLLTPVRFEGKFCTSSTLGLGPAPPCEPSASFVGQPDNDYAC